MGNIVMWFADFFFQVFSKVTSALFKPIFDWAVNYNLISTDYFGTVQDFLNNYFYKYIRFVKETIINITGISPNLFVLLGTLLGFCLLLFISSLTIKAILNLYSLIRTGKTIGGIVNIK